MKKESRKYKVESWKTKDKLILNGISKPGKPRKNGDEKSDNFWFTIAWILNMARAVALWIMLRGITLMSLFHFQFSARTFTYNRNIFFLFSVCCMKQNWAWSPLTSSHVVPLTNNTNNVISNIIEFCEPGKSQSDLNYCRRSFRFFFISHNIHA